MPPNPLLGRKARNLVGILHFLPDISSTLWPYLGRDPLSRVVGFVGRFKVLEHLESDRLDRLSALITQAGVHRFHDELGSAVGARNGR